MKRKFIEDLKARVCRLFPRRTSLWWNNIWQQKNKRRSLKETFKKKPRKDCKILVLRELGKKENVEVSDKEVEEELEKATKNYTKEQLAQIDINQFKEYTKGVLHNEKTFQILESLSE
jgi:FKBP-type peptidyl-prolyl cis-trans isomerase (trigger factor)